MPEEGKVFAVLVRPAGEGGWLVVDSWDGLRQTLEEGEPVERRLPPRLGLGGDEWELKWGWYTPEELEALPEHGGW